jgi:nucleolar protein 14
MFLRFQKERMRRAKKNSSLFNLSDNGPEEQLTHKGKILGDSNFADNDEFSDGDDDDENAGNGSLGKEMVNALHFGGGLVPSNRIDTKMNRMDTLQEIVMKSKLAKLQKKETKLAQEEERENLDRAFKELIGDNEIQFKPMKRERRGRDEMDDNDEEGGDDFGYNQSLQSMAFETKTKVSDRTKSDEEIAIENKARLENLEKERLRRMKAATHDAEADDIEEENDGAGKKRKRKDGDEKSRMNDDYMDDTFGAKTKRSNAAQRRMGGDDDDDLMQEAEGSDDDEEGMNDEEWEEDEDLDDEEEGDEEEDDEGDEDDEEEEEEGEGDEDDEDEEWEDDEEGSEEGDDGDEDDEDVPDYDENDEAINTRKTGRKQSAANNANKQPYDPEADLMPHQIECPTDTLQFYDLIEQYTKRPEQVSVLIDRIVAWHSVHLPGQEGQKNRVAVHNFLDILMKHFVRVGDTLPYSISDEDLGILVSQVKQFALCIVSWKC